MTKKTLFERSHSEIETEISAQESNLIEKSKSLVWARFKDYTAGELRLLEVYLSRINPRDPKSSEVTFTLSEYIRYLGLPGLDVRNVKPQLKHFLGNVVMIDQSDTNNHEFVAYTLFTKASCEFDRSQGQYLIKLNCNPELRPVFFNIANDGYIRYRLRYTTGMKSQYSILLYGMLRDWIHSRKGWTVEIGELRTQLGATSKSYSAFKEMRRWVLDPAVEEINAISDLDVSYDKITKGRTVTGIHFNISVKDSRALAGARLKNGAKHDGKWFALALDGAYVEADKVLSLAQSVRNEIAKKHPNIAEELLDDAAYDCLQSAYRTQIDADRNMNDVIAYLWRVLDGCTDLYLPWSYDYDRN